MRGRRPPPTEGIHDVTRTRNATRVLLLVALATGTHTGSVAAETVVRVENSDRTVWFPSTAVRSQVAPAAHEEQSWFLAVEGGLALYEAAIGQAEFHRLPRGSVITGLQRVDGKLWVATHREGIFVFDPETASFADELRPVDAELRGNLRQFHDPHTGDIWVTRFKRLERYDRATGKWIDLTHIYANIGVRQPSHAFVLPSKSFVWIYSPGTTGFGLLRWERSTGDWRAYRDELFPEGTATTLVTDVVVGRDHVWTYGYADNEFNFHISVYDEQADSWTRFRRADVAAAVDLLIDALPAVAWTARANLARSLGHTVSRIGRISGNHPFRFTAAEQRTVSRMSEKLDQAMTSYGIRDAWHHGVTRDRIDDGRIVRFTPDGEVRELARIHLPSVAYRRLVGTDAAGRLVLFTDRGPARLDLKTGELRHFDAPILPGGSTTRAIRLGDGEQIVLASDWPGFDGPPGRAILWLDTAALEWRRVEGPGERLDPIGSIGGDRLAVRRAEDNSLVVYDPVAESWVPTDDPEAILVDGEELREAYDLPGGGSVKLASDGLVVTAAAP